jgi:hypothetical protein
LNSIDHRHCELSEKSISETPDEQKLAIGLVKESRALLLSITIWGSQTYRTWTEELSRTIAASAKFKLKLH